MKFLLDNIELILSGLGLVVIFAVPMIFFGQSTAWWQVAAVTAIFVGVFHGFIFWSIRRRQRQVRQQAIEEIRGMLKEIVNNQLTVISLSASGLEAERMQRVSNSISRISELIGTLSEESVVDWKKKYADIIETVRQN